MESTGELLITILSSQAQEESRNIIENIRWSLRSKYEKGEPTINYNHFMGYTKGSDGKLKPVMEEVEIVREIFHLYFIGYSISRIKKYLEQHKRKTVMGKIVWQPTVIEKMLSNEKYIGSALMQKTYTLDFLTKQRAKNDGILPKYFVEDNHPAILSKDVFYGVQEEKLWRSYITRQLNGRVSQYSITGKLVCLECGNTYTRVTRKIDGNKYIVWRCKSHMLHGNTVCKKGYSIREEFVSSDMGSVFHNEAGYL